MITLSGWADEGQRLRVVYTFQECWNKEAKYRTCGLGLGICNIFSTRAWPGSSFRIKVFNSCVDQLAELLICSLTWISLSDSSSLTPVFSSIRAWIFISLVHFPQSETSTSLTYHSSMCASRHARRQTGQLELEYGVFAQWLLHLKKNLFVCERQRYETPQRHVTVCKRQGHIDITWIIPWRCRPTGCPFKEDIVELHSGCKTFYSRPNNIGH